MYISSNTNTTNDIWRLLLAQNATKSSSTQSTQASAMPPPPPPGGDTQTSGSDDIKSFLDKVKAGTATEADLSTMKDKLTALKQKFGVTTPSQSGTSDEISTFLDKVAAGTATTDDLTTMKSTLTTLDNNRSAQFNQMSAMAGMMMGGMGPAPGSTASSEDDIGSAIGSLLSKIKEGTVTQDDLTALQQLLNADDSTTGASSTAASSTTTTTVAAASTDTSLDSITAFLEKVKVGTVTDEDLLAMQDTLSKLDQQMSTQAPHGHRHHQTASADTSTATSATTTAADSQEQEKIVSLLLQSLMQAYENNSSDSGAYSFFSTQNIKA